jgi:uncharacterized protein involved in high-affinity Fe2+ transport
MSMEKDDRQKKLEVWQKKLPEEWRQSVLGMPTAEVYLKIQDVTINGSQLAAAQKLDPDLKVLKEQLKTANEPYNEGKKTNNLKIEFLIDSLISRGEKVPDIDCFMSSAAKRLLDSSKTEKQS